jgi:FKBP-type peptidyl-prolyl cis-trans isomerase 2
MFAILLAWNGMKIEKGRKVRLKVDLSVVNGPPLEKTVVEFVQGGGTMLAGLEKVLVGLEKGAQRTGVIPAMEAFGNPSSHPQRTMQRSEFPKEVKLKDGERFVASGANGLNVVLHILKVSGDSIEVRMVHPLAEKDIRYDFEVLAVTDPMPPPMPARAFKLEEA